MDQHQLDHFLEFTMRPYYYQDVAYGSRTLKLDSGEELVMPNVVRTVARCTIIQQYLEHCKETEFQPISRSNMWRVLDVQEASQRKSLLGLDNTTAEGADGFQELLRIVDELERVGAEKDCVCNPERSFAKASFISRLRTVNTAKRTVAAALITVDRLH